MKLYETCYNARELGMIDDPRIEFSSPACNGFIARRELCKQPGKSLFPIVCGNCKWYSVQESIKEKG